jgi:hypothetical protein
VDGAIQFICPQQVYETLGSRSGISDTITWNGNTYRVQSVGPWVDNQFWSAISPLSVEKAWSSVIVRTLRRRSSAVITRTTSLRTWKPQDRCTASAMATCRFTS